MRRLHGSIAVIGVTLALGGCLFRSAESPRFYRPGSAALAGFEDESAVGGGGEGSPLRLHSVGSAPFLRERIIWRVSAVEYGLYEQRRWFELPTRYVRRALTTTLQNTAGLRLVDDVTAPRLDVEILAFDEVLAPKHEASVALAVTLRDGQRTRLERTYSSQVAIEGADGAGTAEAMGRALDEVAKKVAHGAASALAPTAAKPAARVRGASK